MAGSLSIPVHASSCTYFMYTGILRSVLFDDLVPATRETVWLRYCAPWFLSVRKQILAWLFFMAMQKKKSCPFFFVLKPLQNRTPVLETNYLESELICPHNWIAIR